MESRSAHLIAAFVSEGKVRSTITPTWNHLWYLAYVLTPVTWVFGPMKPWLFLPWLTLPLAARVVRIVRNRTDGASLNGALAQTGALQLVFCTLLAAALLLSR